MVKNIVGILVGLVIGMVANMAIIQLNMSFFPPPAGFDQADHEQLSAYLGGLPAQAFVLPIVAHLSQAFLGGWAAARIGEGSPMWLAGIVAAVTSLGGLIMLTTYPAPVWMWIEMPLYAVAAWAAGTLEIRRRAASSA